tara:strand:- start:515 stop:901 length:387 start_codon:yes stop_codon:yes gene_type:complete
MVTKITRGIKISVKTYFQGTYYRKNILNYAFDYSISIENQSSELVQLNTRHWIVLDSLHEKKIIEGEGVIGKKPVIKPGDIHHYESGCVINSPFGGMLGYYTMVNLNSNKKFNVHIPSFKLSVPFALN